MQLSESTIEILKNFSTLNQGLVVKKGNVLKTISTNGCIKAEAEIKESFDQDFAIYDINKTLGILSLDKKSQKAAEIQVDNEHLTFTGLAGHAKIRQRFASPSLIFGYAKLDKVLVIDNWDITFELTEEIHHWIFNVAAVLGCPNIVVKSTDGDTIELFAEDVKGTIVDDASITLDGKVTKPFQAVLKLDNLKILDGSYTVNISKDGITKFTHKNKKIFYYISLEATSKF